MPDGKSSVTSVSSVAENSVAKISPDDIIARVVFDLTVEDNKVRVINQTFFEKASELGIRQVFNEVAGLSGDKLNAAVEAAKRSHWLRGKLLTSTQKITGINRTTQNLVANQLKQGLEAGETVTDLASRIKNVLPGNPQACSVDCPHLDRRRSRQRSSRGYEGCRRSKRRAGWIVTMMPQGLPTRRQAVSMPKASLSICRSSLMANRLCSPATRPARRAILSIAAVSRLRLLPAGKSFDLDYYDKLKFYSYSKMNQCNPRNP